MQPVNSAINTLLQTLTKAGNSSNLTNDQNKNTGSFLENLAWVDKENSEIYAKLEKEIKQSSQMFKQFDFMQLLNKLQFGNLEDKERAEIFAKMTKIAREI